MSGSWKTFAGILLVITAAMNDGLAARTESPGSAFRRGDIEKTIKLLIPQAQAGDIGSQIMLGQMYLKGQGVPVDTAKAIEWIRKAADQGSAIAAYDLGVFSANGIGGSQDAPAAAAWFRKSAHQRYPDAAYNLATLLHKGIGIERDDVLALTWIDAGIQYLPSKADSELRSRFGALHDSIAAGMTPAQLYAASQLVSKEGPLVAIKIKNRDAIQKLASTSYPLGLRELGRGGTVVALVLVRADGTVAETSIETSSGYPELDSSTLQLLMKAEIEPRLIAGQPVESWQLMRSSWHVNEEPWYSFHNLNKMGPAH